jgi:hypothetical protein
MRIANFGCLNHDSLYQLAPFMPGQTGLIHDPQIGSLVKKL